MIQHPRDLIEHHSNVLGAQRRLDAEQTFDSKHVGVLVAHHGHVVEPVHVADALVVRLAFRELLGGPVQEADVRIRSLDGLSVHLQDQAQHPVRGRMLRPEVQREVANLGHPTRPHPGCRPRQPATGNVRRGE